VVPSQLLLRTRVCRSLRKFATGSLASVIPAFDIGDMCGIRGDTGLIATNIPALYTNPTTQPVDILKKIYRLNTRKSESIR
jgi:hypothetical protein